MTDELANGITAAIEREAAGVTPPVMDLDAVRRRGNRRRLTRAGVTAALVLTVVGGGYGVVSQLGDQERDKAKDAPPPFAPAAMDFSAGARAYYDPDNSEMYLGGKRFPLSSVYGLDTDATVSSGGVVYFMSDQQPRLLQADGAVVDLAPAPASPDSNFNPSATAEPGGNQVAWLTKGGDGVRLGLSDVTTAETTTHDLSAWCSQHGDCATLTVVALDSGFLFLRDDDGSYVVPQASGEPVTRVADGQLADVRNKVMLVDGPVPTKVPAALDGGWRFARAAGIEALLTFDGAHQLYWSETLEPTTPGQGQLKLDVPGRGTAFVAMDTDGSILVARDSNDSPRQTYYDCEVPSGACTEIGTTDFQSGDPMFIGVDE